MLKQDDHNGTRKLPFIFLVCFGKLYMYCKNYLQMASRICLKKQKDYVSSPDCSQCYRLSGADTCLGVWHWRGPQGGCPGALSLFHVMLLQRPGLKKVGHSAWTDGRQGHFQKEMSAQITLWSWHVHHGCCDQATFIWSPTGIWGIA